MGMSFGMIFSIILIVFFIVVGGIAVNAFLKWQKEMQLGLAIKELDGAIKLAFNSENYDKTVKISFPSGVQEVCFINWSAQVSSDASNIDSEIFNYARKQTHKIENNFFIYSPDRDYNIRFATVKYIDLTSKNPICITLKNSVASIKIQRTFENPLVRVSEV